jgi:hypothetical protein
MAELELEEPGEISHTSAEPFIRPDQVGVTVIQGMLLTIATSWMALQSMLPQCNRRSWRATALPGCAVLSWIYICRRNQRRAATAIKPMPMKSGSTRHNKAYHSDDSERLMSGNRQLNIPRRNWTTTGISSFTSRNAASKK